MKKILITFLCFFFIRESLEKSEVEVTARNCTECAGDKSTIQQLTANRCAEYRKLGKKHKFELKDMLDDPLMKKFFVKCEPPLDECYSLKAADKRILGYEEKGCGVGPEEVDSEPGEPCGKHSVSYLGVKVKMINCVCDTDYCNRGVANYRWSLKFTLAFFLLLLQGLG